MIKKSVIKTIAIAIAISNQETPPNCLKQNNVANVKHFYGQEFE